FLPDPLGGLRAGSAGGEHAASGSHSGRAGAARAPQPPSRALEAADLAAGGPRRAPGAGLGGLHLPSLRPAPLLARRGDRPGLARRPAGGGRAPQPPPLPVRPPPPTVPPDPWGEPDGHGPPRRV